MEGATLLVCRHGCFGYLMERSFCTDQIFDIRGENVPVGTVVIQVNATDLDQGANSEIIYSFGKEVDARLMDVFSIDVNTGEIQVIGQIDFEQSKSYEIDIQASDKGPVPLTTDKSVMITVIDVNDNAPEIEVTSFSSSIKEDSKIGTTVALISVSDLDSGINGKVICTINEDVPFSLSPSLQENMYAVVTRSQLDRERVSNYDVTIVAKDTGEPSFSTEKTIRVIVSDVNDNSPQFSSSPYTFYITENNSPGASVVSVKASDRDESDNALISYHILREASRDNKLTSFLNINSETGDILALKSFDFEVLKKFQFQVVATDSGTPSLSSNVTVNVFILDQNDNAPVILYPVSSNGSAEGVEEIPRNVNAGHLVTKVRAYDNDGILYVSRKIDREEVCAQSSTCLINLKTVLENPLEVHYVRVEVLDINDHSPSFPDEETTLEISESVLPGARFQLKPSRDADSGHFSVQQYKLSHNDHFRLEVKDKGEDGKIPILVVQKSLDRETAVSHSLVLTALDGGKPPKSGEMNILINVLDINDNAPVFSKDAYSVMLDENSPVGTTVLQVNATDLDEGSNGEVVYSLSKSMNKNILHIFDIDPSTGEMVVKGLIDYEKKDKYDIEIEASDKGFAPLTTEKNVIIKIVDVNDNAPEIEVTSFSSSIPEDSRPGTTVALISVNDLDSGLNGKVICSISDDVPFTLSPSLQDNMYSLVTKSLLDREKQSLYVLTITAKDAGQPPLSSQKTISVVVSDVNDNSPEFSLSPYTFYVTEGNEPGTSVFSVKAFDRDENDNALISYHILRDGREENKLASFLNINSETGDILALKSFDFEVLKKFHFQVVATDSGTPSLSSNVTVNVFILDQNDNAPVILYPVSSNGSAEGVEEIPRNVNAGHLVTKVRAYDADIGYNGWLLFSLQEVTDHSLFGLDRYTGQIRTHRSFTETDEAEHKLLILVKDNGNVSLSATATVIVKLVEPKEAFAASDVKSATKVDDEDNVTFYLMITLGSVSVLFIISIINDGILYVSRKIDREEVCAQSSTCLINLKTVLENPLEVHYVEVEVLDINDHSPSFPDEETTLEISENVLPGARFQLKPSRDPDSGHFSVQQYKLSQNDHFRLEVKNRGDDGKIPILVVQKSLDRETTGRHSLVLTALDGGKPPKSGNMNIIVNVLDINDNAPVFSKELYSVMLDENAPVGTTVIEVNSTDLDEGSNGEVVYSFSKSMNKNILNTFDINTSTGEIVVKGHIDYEKKEKYDIEIEASDKGFAPLTTEKSVIIQIVDVNDNAPEIEVTSFSSSVPEDSRPGTTVALISVNDWDSGLNGKVICSISDDVPFTLSPSVKDKMYSLVTKSPLDREKQSHYELTITAKDAGQPPLSSEKTISVVVSDVNDNSPEFSLSPYTFYVTEANEPGTSVFSVKAFDRDENDNALISYHILRDGREENKLVSFLNINSETGDILALKSFDFEVLKKFQFQVVATDSGAPSLSSNVTVNVFILDQNDNAPVILYPVSSNGSAEGVEEIPRNVNAGHLVTKVRAYDADIGYNGWLLFSLNADPLFHVNQNDGILYVSRKIDREEVCAQSSTCLINLKTVLENPLEVHYVEMEVLDINDHSPSFPEKDKRLEISENVLPGARFQLKPSRDLDSRHFSVQHYKLSQNDHFRLEVKDKGDDGKIPILVVQKSLDREAAGSHSLVLTALDGGKPPKSGEMNIIVNVLDINDNAPVFSKDVYSVMLDENAPVGTTVTQVNATDLDEGPNGDVVYSFSNSMNQKILNLFDINPLTGEIIVKSSINYEEKDRYEIEIEASDKGLVPLTTEKSVIIKIVDVNDNAPEIEVTSFSSSIPEDSRPGTTVALISVNDLDSGLNGKVICSISDDVPFTLSPSLKDKMYSLVTKSPLDREKQSHYELTITAKDAGQPPLSSEKTISVVVSDVNDNSPEFSTSPYTFYVNEANEPGTSVFSVKAFDHKSTLTERKYRIVSSNADPLFHVNQNDGMLFVSRKIDREEVCAQSSTCLINLKTVLENPLEVHYVGVEVLDINDHSPSFPEKDKRLDISENVLPGARLQLKPSRDPDSGHFSVQQYKLSQNDHFRLEVKDKGEDGKIPMLVVQKSLDRETAGSHSLVLTALDGGKPPKSGEMNILVNVLDINDNAPVFSKDVYSVMLDENAPVGTAVIQVNATDLDEGANGEVVYSFSNSMNQKILNLFDINPLTGEVTVKGSINYEEKDRYEIEIEASDKGLVPLSTDKSVIIKIVDVNDNTPEIEVTSFSSSIPEDSRPGTTVALISVNDLDSGLNGKVICSISDNVPFTLSPSLQDKMYSLVTKSPLDREKHHSLVLTALDGGKPPKSGEMNIKVNVLDINDNAPFFSKEVYSVTLDENAPVGTTVLQVNATDLDEGPNGEVAYSFTNSINQRLLKLFDISPSTGEIIVKGLIDYEHKDKYEIEIQASDKGLAPLATEKSVIIKIVDVNDNAPEIEVTSFSSSIPEDSRPGTTVALISVNDLDSGLNGKVICSISDDVPFTLSPSLQDKMYSLVTKSPLDREKQSHYELTITAKDAGQPPLSSEKTISVVVSDVNDNSPEFSLSPYTFYVNEANEPGTSVFSVKAFDRDESDNALISYHILRDGREENKLASFLNINSETGDILALKSFDFEVLKKFQFQVVATDSGTPSLSSNVTVNVFILDQNDNAPVILYPVSSNGSAEGVEEIPRNVNAGHLVTKVRAYDADIGYNGWLLFSLQEVTDHSLFGLDRYTGQIRTHRSFTETDEAEHKLLILVKDNGNVSLSATATVIVKLVEPKEAFAASDVKSATKVDEEDNVTFYLMITLGSVSVLLIISIIVLIAMQCSKSTDYTSKYLQETNYDGTLCHSIQYRSGDKRYMLVGPRMSIGSTIVPGSHANTLVLPDRRRGSGEVRHI
uniref:Cadherin domain-containing protein n=1 Tax=Sparus aurata TaxID=8175 RepID=A0A671U5E4_SPAAU